ncbi:dynamin-related protein 4C-like [Rutidosis leptorrhynchoides]|uniref:dynamin-related protein 4C-like n=1 Tax=Rutidosis leptorrhynchoides TaxID=125765 RepID=UPI003A9904BF
MGPAEEFSSNSSSSIVNFDAKPLSVFPPEEDEQDMSNTAISAPIISSYNEKIRPLLDAVDSLRRLNIMKEGIQLPTIVVVGDQSSGKSSVLESLAGITLPRGQGICTRVPLIMRLQNQGPYDKPEFSLECNGKIVHSDEAHIAEAIVAATGEIAGTGKGISNKPLTLVVKKKGVPDLTMVDLPGITRVPVQGQPENIHEQITNMIMEYIKPEQSIILNVISASVDFSTCESITLSQKVDRTGQRTLAVVTKVDKSPEGLLEKVTSDDVNIGLGYVCVRNRIGDESYDEARKEEAEIFETHPLLSKIDKSIVGIPVLAQKLTQIQANSIARNMPDIVRQINDKLNASVSEFNNMPRVLSSSAEVMTTFMRVIGSTKDSLRKILLAGEFEEYPDNKKMHCTARLVEMLNSFSVELRNCEENDSGDFLVEELEILEESKSIGLPNFLPRNAFLTVLQKRVDKISRMPVEFIEKVWDYIEVIVITVLMHHSSNYHQLQLSARRATNNFSAKMKEHSVNRVMEIVQMEKLTDYTSSPDYMSEWTKLMSKWDTFLENVKEHQTFEIGLGGFMDAKFETSHLSKFSTQSLNQAFDLKMRMIAYWKIVLRRLVDSMALHLQFSLQNLVDKEMEAEIVNELMDPHGGGLERLLEESPSVAGKREKLSCSINLLRKSKAVVAKIMDNFYVTTA